MFCAADFWIAKPPFPAEKFSRKPYEKPGRGSRSNPAREHWHKFIVIGRSNRDMRRASAGDELHFSVNNFIKVGIFRLRARKIAGIFHRIYGLDFEKIISNFLARIKFRIERGSRKKPDGESERCQNDNA